MMKRAALIFLIVFSASVVCAGEGRDTTVVARGALAVSRQMSSACAYSPSCPVFFTQARRELGFFPALFATADRITRSSGRIGIAGRSFKPDEDGFRHEGPEAYRIKKSPQAPVQTVSTPPVVLNGSKPLAGDYDFVRYLLDNDFRLDAWTLLSTGGYAPSDTLDFLRGDVTFSMKKLDEAAHFYSQVPSTSPFYEKSFFYSVVADAHLGRIAEASALLETYGREDNSELASLQRAGLALLEGDAPAWRQAAAGFSYADYTLAASERTLDAIAAFRFETRRRSPALAAAMSAVVPGLGKIYAGRTGEGISSFLYVGILGAITAENWIKAGPTNWKTILFGTAASLFYIGNIYGSYVSVGLYYNDLQNEQDTAILYNIHIPLRSIFR